MDRKEYIKGLINGGGAFAIWGLLPLYWKTVSAISPYQLFSQRVVWSFVFVTALMVYRGEWSLFVKLVSDRRNWASAILPSMMISINWLLFIWAVNNGFVIEASLGYYINPLVLTLLGLVFLKERLNKLQKTGIAFAFIGVVIKSFYYGKIPYVSFALAISFAFYGFMKKKSALKSLYGLGFETLIAGIFLLPYLLFNEFTGSGITGNLPWHFWLKISLSGIFTAIPLIMFAEGTMRLPLSIMGFLQYIAPTGMLLLGVLVFGEPFDLVSAISFGLIWIGLGFFSYSQYLLLSKDKQKRPDIPIRS
jgi:chloramphenicol-sensitive protein RarD